MESKETTTTAVAINQSQQNDLQPSQKRGFNNRFRPRNNNKGFAPKRKFEEAIPSKSKQARFDKQDSKTTVFTSSLQTYFELQTEFHGAVSVTSTLYDILEARDNKMVQFFTKLELIYVVLLATYYRTALVTNKSKTYIIHGLGVLKESIAHILLPDVVCRYIECIGVVECINGIQVVPWFRDYREMQRQPWFVDAYDFLTPAQREHILPAWSINDSVITRVQNGLARALKGCLEIRSIKEESDGDKKFLTGWRRSDYDRILPLVSERLDVNEATLGACFQFRTDEIEEHVGLKLPLVHEAPAVYPPKYINIWMKRAMRSEV